MSAENETIDTEVIDITEDTNESDSISKENVSESKTNHQNTGSEKKDTPGFDTKILDNVLSSLFKGFNHSESEQNNKDDTDSVYEDLELDLYLLDESGNNICDHLKNVDTTLNKINDSIQEFMSVYKATHSS